MACRFNLLVSQNWRVGTRVLGFKGVYLQGLGFCRGCTRAHCTAPPTSPQVMVIMETWPKMALCLMLDPLELVRA